MPASASVIVRRAATLAVATVLAASCSGGHPSPAPTSSEPVIGFATCLPKAPPEGTLSVTKGTRGGGLLAPGTPRTLTICRYSRLPTQRLLASRHVADAPMLKVQGLLNGLRIVPAGKTFPCPVDLGDVDLLVFRYGPAHTVPIKISRSGCRFATNRFGRQYRTTPALRRELDRLVGGV